MRPPDRTCRITATYVGRVQGVGFRFTTVRIAQGHDITGYVANVPDGTVRVVGEGDEKTLRAFLGEILHSGVGRFVTDVHAEWGAASGEFEGFSVSYHSPGGSSLF